MVSAARVQVRVDGTQCVVVRGLVAVAAPQGSGQDLAVEARPKVKQALTDGELGLDHCQQGHDHWHEQPHSSSSVCRVRRESFDRGHTEAAFGVGNCKKFCGFGEV